jgi:hypothetical protein
MADDDAVKVIRKAERTAEPADRRLARACGKDQGLR